MGLRSCSGGNRAAVVAARFPAWDGAVFGTTLTSPAQVCYPLSIPFCVAEMMREDEFRSCSGGNRAAVVAARFPARDGAGFLRMRPGIEP